MADVRPINFTATASESDLNSDNFLWLDTPQKAKKLPGDAIAPKSVQDDLVTAVGNITQSIAEIYVPETTDAVAGKLYMYQNECWLCNVDTSGAWVENNFTRYELSKGTVVRIDNPDTSSAPFNDLDTFPVNTSVMCSVNFSGVAHKPSNRVFTCITLSNSKSFVLQVVTDSSKRLFVRQKFETWGNWKCLVDNDLPIEIVINPDTSSAPFDDLNTFPVNTFALVTLNVEDVSHNPESNPVMVLTIGTTGNNAIQFAMEYGNKRVYMRSKWGEWADWSRLDNGIKFEINPNTSSSPYNDLDSFPINEFVLVSINVANVANKPTSNAFQVYTWGASANVAMQMLITNSGESYVRTKWNNWSSWKNMTSSILPIQIKTNPDTSSAPYNDADTFTQNELVLVSSNYAAVENIPVSSIFFMVTLSASNSARLQFFASSNGKIYVRCRVVSWSSWKNIEESSQASCDILSAFTNILCVGDSLTWSHVYTTATLEGSRQAYKPYPTVLGNITGATITVKAKAGDSATMCWDRYNDEFVAMPNSLAIIYLGTNEGLTDTLETDAPENTSYENWASTNTGCYAKIVAKLQSLGYKILLVKPFAVSQTASLADSQKAVGDIATRFGCSVVGPIYSADDQYHYWPDRQGKNAVHYNDLGYSWFAHKLVDVVASLGENLKWIIPE